MRALYNAAMILYHFTSLWSLGNVGPDNILAAGLKAMPADRNGDYVAAVGHIPDCVWLTANADMADGYSSFSEARIKLVIQSTDKRLVAWPKYVRRNARVPVEALHKIVNSISTEWQHWYLYFGNIPPDAFRAVETTEEAVRANAAIG
jgi:hypothetical protein